MIAACSISQVLAADSGGNPSVAVHGLYAMQAVHALRSQHLLIEQMFRALESCGQGAKEDGGQQWHDEKLVDAAYAAGEAYLKSPEALAPIDMVLHCPECDLQHIDGPDWQNDPQLGAIRYANAQQRIDTSGDREAQQSHHEPVQVLLREGGMASGGHAEQPVQEVQLPATAIHEANKGMHVVSSGNGRFTVLQGQQNGQPSPEVQGLPQERNRRLEEDQSGRGESGGTSTKQSAARDEAIRLDARGVSGAPESSRADLQHLREGRASEAQEGPSIAGSLPCNGQDSGRAVLSLQHDAGLRERRLNVASQRDQVSCEAPLRAPIHRSHLCRPEDGGCGHIWRPADVPTNGVKAVETKGKADSPIAARAPADSVMAPAGGAAAWPDAKDADGHHLSVKAGWSLHGYRQGTKEGIAFHRGAMWWHAAAPTPAAQGDAALEAVRKRLCELPRSSFITGPGGGIRRVADRTGSWIEFDAAHALFDPVAVDAALARNDAALKEKKS